jgi:hypothetical protein
VKLRPSLLLAPVVAGLSLGTLAPAQAATTDPVTDLVVSAVQKPGSHDSFRVTASWTVNPDARRYKVSISDEETGGATYGGGPQDVTGSSASFDVSTLAPDENYWVIVQPTSPDRGTATATTFHTPALDTTAPTGTYQLDRTSAYLTSADLDISDIFSGVEGEADFRITQTALPDGAKTRQVLAGDGTPAKSWTTGSTFTLTYNKAGVFTPHVLLTDEFANTRDIALPAVHVVRDATGPSIQIATPARPGRAASWRVIRGTATDTGTGVAAVGVGVLEKRGSTWWAYDFKKKEWLKGYSSRSKTESKTKARGALIFPSPSGTWRSPAIKGLVKGKLRVEAAAIDTEFNIGIARPVTRKVH